MPDQPGMLERITPLILTYNEEPNIERTLSRLAWARDIVVIDSFSTDATLKICQRFPQVRVKQRVFDSHARQWTFGLCESSITTEWVLALDADYVLSDEFVAELVRLTPDAAGVVGYRAGFRYCVWGKPLRGTLYPPVTVLYRRERACYVQDGHTQRVMVEGEVRSLRGWIFHDDRKPLSRWLQGQDRYMQLEVKHIRQTPWKALRNTDRLRRLIVISPFVVFLYCLLIKGGVFDGRAGWYYALQRMLAETMLSLRLLENDTHGS